MELTLIDTGRTGRVTLGRESVTYRSYEVSERRIVELHEQYVRPHTVNIYSNGRADVFLIFVTKRGADFKLGHGYSLSLTNMRERNTLPEVREAIELAVAALSKPTEPATYETLYPTKQMECIYPARPNLGEAIEMLEAIGAPNKIAEHLTRMGVKAEKGCTTNCAAHRFYDLVTDLEDGFEVCPSDVTGEVIRDIPGGDLMYYVLPINTNLFANWFDAGRYPELAHGGE
jgi:hypothetical protein